jgi:hypothetical protein
VTARIYPWELTCEEFIGPRALLRALPPEFVESKSKSLRSFGVPRTKLDGVWVEHVDKVGSLIFETATSETVLGSALLRKVWTVSEELRGTGLVAKVSADYYNRYGREPAELLDCHINWSLTPEGSRAAVRMHTLCVQLAAAEGLPVPAHVLDSVADASERIADLRAGDDSALRLVDDRRILRKLRGLRGTRYTAVKMRQAYLDRLPDGMSKRQLMRLIVVSD